MGFLRSSACVSVLVAFAVMSCGLDVVGVSGSSSGSLEPDASTPTRDSSVPGPEDAGTDADVAAPPENKITISVTDLGDATQTIDLTSEGTLDWVYWAHEGNPSKDVHKAGVTPLIASPFGVGGNAVVRGTNMAFWPITQTWTDGTAPASGSSGWYTYFTSNDATVTMNVAAATTPRTFTFIAGAYDADAVVEAKLLDTSAQQSAVNAVGIRRYLRFAVTYQSAVADRWLEVKWRVTKLHSLAGWIGVTSATLK